MTCRLSYSVVCVWYSQPASLCLLGVYIRDLCKYWQYSTLCLLEFCSTIFLKKTDLNKIFGLFSEEESGRSFGRNQHSFGNIINSVKIRPGVGSGPCSAPLMPVVLTELSVHLKCKQPRLFWRKGCSKPGNNKTTHGSIKQWITPGSWCMFIISEIRGVLLPTWSRGTTLLQEHWLFKI